MSEQHVKDIHRYSYSRLSTFKMCPRKHHYIYVEQLPEPDNEYALSGSLFHECIERILTGQEVDEIYSKWYDAVDTGKIRADRDLLEYIVNSYFSHYYNDYKKENTLVVEETFTEPLEYDDYFVSKLDQAYEFNGLIGIRDIKTTRGILKYNEDNVRTNMQLLTYVPALEKKLGQKVSFIEIDEVRLAKLADEVPLIKNGKPSTSLEALNLVTADLYREELQKQGLEQDQKYQNVLFLLEQRGHPLFNRVRVQLSNRLLLETNQDEISNLYLAASLDIKYRIKDQQKCFYCPFKSVCQHDEQAGGERMRQEIIQKT